MTQQQQPSQDIQATSQATTHKDVVSRFVNFSKTTFDALEELAKLNNSGSLADALRDSIALSKWFNETVKDNDKILIERKGKLYEVIRK